MKIFLTGSKGFIGSHLLPKLQNLGNEVITDYRYFNDQYDCVIHLAAVTHIRNEFDPKMFEANIILTNEVFKKNCRIIYASSCSAAHFTNPYAGTKLWAEYLGRKHGNAIGLRFHNVYGNGNNKGIVWFLLQQPDGAKITIRGPELVRDYIHVDDVVNEIIRNTEREIPVTINVAALREIASGVPPLTTKQLIDLAFDQGIFAADKRGHTGELQVVVDVGTGLGTQTMDLVNLFQKLSGKSFDISVEEAGVNEPKEMISNYKIPSVSLEDGLKKTLWFYNPKTIENENEVA